MRIVVDDIGSEKCKFKIVEVARLGSIDNQFASQWLLSSDEGWLSFLVGAITQHRIAAEIDELLTISHLLTQDLLDQIDNKFEFV